MQNEQKPKFRLVENLQPNSPYLTDTMYHLEVMAITMTLEGAAAMNAGRVPAVGDKFRGFTDWPIQSDGISHTDEDREKYGTRWATGIFERIS